VTAFDIVVGVLVTTMFLVPAATVMAAFPRVTRRGTGFHLAAAHTVLMLGPMALAPLWVLADPDPMYGDLYPPFFVVPGLHIHFAACRLFDPVFPWLLGFMEPFPASILCIVVGPGLVGMIAGGLQWFLIGAAWDRIDRLLPQPADAK
jgi:hypothetical protein